jgi:hypothetical protein
MTFYILSWFIQGQGYFSTYVYFVGKEKHWNCFVLEMGKKLRTVNTLKILPDKPSASNLSLWKDGHFVVTEKGVEKVALLRNRIRKRDNGQISCKRRN